MIHTRIAQFGLSSPGTKWPRSKRRENGFPLGQITSEQATIVFLKWLSMNFIIEENEYNVPLKPNYPAIDSLAPHRGEIYQCTAAETHRIKIENLEALKPHFDKWQEANSNAKVKLIFVLPPSRFSHNPIVH
jgi:hypothetical protein